MNKKGFTLMEIIIAIVLMGIVASTAFIAYNKAYNSTNIKLVKHNEVVIGEQLIKYYQIEGHLPQNNTEFYKFLHNTYYFPQIVQNPFYVGDDYANGWVWTLSTPTSGTVKAIEIKEDGKDITHTVSVQPYESINNAIENAFTKLPDDGTQSNTNYEGAG